MNLLLKSNIFKNSLILFLSKGGTTIIGLLSSIFYGVIFSKSDIAIIVLFEMFVQIIVSTFFSWSGLGVIRFGKGEIERNGSLNCASSVRLQLFLSLLLLPIVALVIFRDEVQNYVGLISNTTIVLMIVNIILLALSEHISLVYSSLEKHVINAITNIFLSLFKVSLLALFFLNILDADIIIYLSANIIGLLVLLIWRFWILDKRNIFPLFKSFEKEKYTRFLSYSAPQFFGFVGLFVISSIDTIVIKKYCSLDDLGAYTYVYSLFMKIAAIAYIVNTVFFPRILSWKNSNDIKKIYRYIKVLPILAFSLAMFFAVAFSFVFPALFDMVFNDKFESAYSSFTLMLFVLPLYFLVFTIVPIINAYDKVLHLQIINIVAALVNFLIDILLVPKIGIIGGAIGTISCYALTCIGLIFLLYKMRSKFEKNTSNSTKNLS